MIEKSILKQQKPLGTEALMQMTKWPLLFLETVCRKATIQDYKQSMLITLTNTRPLPKFSTKQ
jgi:hypothetical protein